MYIDVWGTGKKACEFVQRLDAQNSWASKYLDCSVCSVRAFIDNDSKKNGQLFAGVKIIAPNHYDWDSRKYLLLVAVKNNKEILRQLDEKGYKRKVNYIVLDDIPRWFWVEQNFVEAVAEKLGIGAEHRLFLARWKDSENSNEIEKDIAFIWKCVEDACKTNGVEEAMYVQSAWVREAILLGESRNDKDKAARCFIHKIGAPAWTGILEEIYGDNIVKASSWLPQKKVARQRPFLRTIGIYYKRMYNGGIERVLSQLIPIFLNHGYKVVLITDVIDEEKEYSLPKAVKRVCLGEYVPFDKRYEKIVKAIREYDIDIYCSHSYAPQVLYDIFCVKEEGIPAIVELHNIFSLIIDFFGSNSLVLCQCADAVVTLSRVDEMFWKLLSCNSAYVPNPILPKAKIDGEHDRHTVLWLQRIDQEQKRVFDLPVIMKYVVREMPDAKLLIVGRADKPKIEKELRLKFGEMGLSGNVVFMGFHTDVEPYYRQATVMLMTSAFEGFPMTIVESKRFGVPLVLYDLPYLELLKDGRGYISVQQGDCRGAAKALLKILDNENLREKLSVDASNSLDDFCRVDIMSEWEKVFAKAESQFGSGKLTEDEKTFSKVERLLLQLADKVRLHGINV